MKVRYVAFRGISLISWAIRFVTRSEGYSHVAYLSTRGDLIECWQHFPDNPFGRWEISSFANHRPGTPYEIWEREFPEDEKNEIEAFFYGLAEQKTKYDWFALIGFVGYFVPKLIKHSMSRFMCSEGLLTGFIKPLKLTKVKPQHESPQDAVEILEAAGFRLSKTGTT